MRQIRHVGGTLLRYGALLLITFSLTACDVGPQAAKPDALTEIRQGADPTAQPAKPTRTPQGELDVAAVLPVGTLAVDIMELAPSQRVQELTTRMQFALAENQEWWQEYLRENADERPLPYHPNMGLSEEEYEEFLEQAQDLSLAKTGEATLKVSSPAAGLLVLDGGEDLPELTGLEFDLERNVLAMPYGTTTDYDTLHPRKSALGAWDGAQWSLEKAESEDLSTLTGTVAKLALGTLQESGRQVLYYDVKQVEDGVAVEQITIILYYDLPGDGTTD